MRGQHTKFAVVLAVVIILIAGFFLVDAFGGTQFNLTLTTNKDLENGLTNHWTFDGPDMDWATDQGEVLDRGSQGVDGWASSTAALPPAVSYVGTGNSGNRGSEDCTGGCTQSFNHTSGDLFVVGFSVNDATDSDSDISNVQWNSVAMTPGPVALQTGVGRVEIWYLEDPATGTNNLTWDNGGTVTDESVGFVSLNNVGAVDASDTATGDSTAPSVTLSVSTEEVIVVDTVFTEDNGPTITVGGGSDRNARWNIDLGADVGAGSTEDPASAGSVTMNWTTGAEIWAIGAIAFGPDPVDPDPANVPGRLGQGMEFDGTYDYVDIGDAYPSTADTANTISFWVRADEATSESIIDINGTNEIITNASDQITVDGGAGATYYVDGVSGNRVITNKKWHHVVVTDSTGWNPSNFDIGRDGTSYFGGRIDDVRTYNRVLSASEISRLYELGATTKLNKTLSSNAAIEDSLVLHWTFDGPNIDTGETNEVRDRAGTYHASLDSPLVPGKIGQASEEDSGAQITASGLPTDDFSYSFWLKPESSAGGVGGTDVPIFWTQDETLPYLALAAYYDHAGEQISLTTKGTETHSTADSVPINEWSHIVFSRDGTSNVLTIYINGESNNSATHATDPAYSCNEFNLGDVAAAASCAGTGAGEWYNGLYDDFRIYSKALSAEEAARLYELGATTRINKTLTTNPDLENGLVRHYTFDGKYVDWGATNEILDRGSQGVDADVGTGIQSALTPGKIGQGYDVVLAGGEEIVAVDTSLPTGDFTYSIWVWKNSTDTISSFFGSALQAAASYEIAASRNVGGAIAFVVDGATGFTTAQTIPLQKWTHVVLRRDGSTIEAFVNGVKDSNSATDGDTLSFVCDLDIGGLGQGFTGLCDFAAASTWGGRIDDFRVYDRALSDAEVLRLYQLGE